jgi:DNA ligase (NAD+)
MNQKELENKIKEAQKEYYAGHPILCDSEFDKLWDDLKNLYPDSELLSEVGSDLEESDGFEKVELKSLMGSQSKANTAEEMDKFISENGSTYMETYKLDGSSAELYYENGKFIRGCSRGDGHLGVNYTNNISKMQGVIKNFSIPYTGVVKGEIVLSQKNKDKYFSEFKNARNCATGIFHRLSGEDCDKLNFVAWDAFPTDGKDYFSTQEELLGFLENEGFEVTPHRIWKKVSGKEAIERIHKVWEEELPNYDYDCDGLVWKKNEIDWEDLKINERPKTQIALKPAKVFAESIVTDIKWNVVNGTITPVVQFNPVDIQGSTITQASGYNVSFLEEMKLEIGDKVLICRGGMIIPTIAKNVSKNIYNPKVNF